MMSMVADMAARTTIIAVAAAAVVAVATVRCKIATRLCTMADMVPHRDHRIGRIEEAVTTTRETCRGNAADGLSSCSGSRIPGDRPEPSWS